MVKLDDLSEIIKMRLRQLDHVSRQIDAREARTRHAKTRKQWLERQNRANYRNELDRVRGELSRTTVRHDYDRLKRREEELKKLFSHGNV